jgi:hypothetical protein
MGTDRPRLGRLQKNMKHDHESAIMLLAKTARIRLATYRLRQPLLYTYARTPVEDVLCRGYVRCLNIGFIGTPFAGSEMETVLCMEVRSYDSKDFANVH